MKDTEKISVPEKTRSASNQQKEASHQKPRPTATLIQKASKYPKALTSSDVLQLRAILGNYSTTQLMKSINHADSLQHPVQLKTDVIQMEGEGDNSDIVRQSVGLLKEVQEMKSIPQVYLNPIRKAIHELEKSGNTEHAKLIQDAKKKLPPDPTKLKSRYIHGIWVQGDYTENEELKEGMQTRKGTKAEQWENLIWVYQSLQESNASQFQQVDGMVCRSIKVDNMDMLEVDFKASMGLWKEKPDWVGKFLPLLDILLEKKSFVTMSDIMRMIILYYKGGLYQDVKIQLESPEAKFFDEPLVNVDKLQLVDEGSNKENWAMVAEAGCKMIEEIMSRTLSNRFPKAEVLKRLPVNYSNGGQYSQAHQELHEGKGPWPEIQKLVSKVDLMSVVNPDLVLKNPRPVNSWANTDRYVFDWDADSA